MLKILWLVLAAVILVGVSFFSLSDDIFQKVSIATSEPVEQIIAPVTFHATAQTSKENSFQTTVHTSIIENSANTESSIQKIGASTSEYSTLINTEYVSQNDLQYGQSSDDSGKKDHNSADTSHITTLPIANIASKRYIHYTPNFEFLIPSGWYAIQGSNNNKALFMPTNQNMNNGTDNFVIVMSVRNLSEAATTPESLYNDCINELSYKIVNGIPIREKRSTCNDHNYEGYSFVKNSKIITIAYITLPQGDKFKENDYEKLVSTLKVDDPSPVKDIWRHANGFQIYHKKILTPDSELEMKYYSVSQIDEFTVDLESKQIMLVVSESKDLGSTIIPVSELFVKPYAIIVDGNKSDGVLIKDETEGISEMFVLYKKGTHTIKISGGELVPTLVAKSFGTPEPTKSNPNTQQFSVTDFRDAVYGWIQSIHDLFK
jgi:hypothetical protein